MNYYAWKKTMISHNQKRDISCQLLSHFHLWIILYHVCTYIQIIFFHSELNIKAVLTILLFPPFNPENIVRTSPHVLIPSGGPVGSVFWPSSRVFLIGSFEAYLLVTFSKKNLMYIKLHKSQKNLILLLLRWGYTDCSTCWLRHSDALW